MIRRGFWLTAGAVTGIYGYRRVSALGRRLSASLNPAGSGPNRTPEASVTQAARLAHRAIGDGAAQPGQGGHLPGEFGHPGAELVHAGGDRFGAVQLAVRPVHGGLGPVDSRLRPLQQQVTALAQVGDQTA